VSLKGFDGKIYRPWLDSNAQDVLIDWVICGPETGPKARPMKSKWICDLYRQCTDVEVPFFDKKNVLGLNLKQFPEVTRLEK
jgi:protein gp37